jgi:hypothetical protein
VRRLALAERNKRREYEASGDGAGYDFVPLAVESYGRMGVEASQFLSALGKIAEERAFGVTKARFVRHARQELSCALVRVNAWVCHEVMKRFARAAGTRLSPGLGHASDELSEE